MILAIVGSSDIPEPDLVDVHQRIMSYIGSITQYRNIEKIISGGAEGVDTMAERAAELLEIEFEAYLPENKRWKPNGFMERNKTIAEECTHLLCIRWAGAKTYGSGWTADYAEKLGKTVWREML